MESTPADLKPCLPNEDGIKWILYQGRVEDELRRDGDQGRPPRDLQGYEKPSAIQQRAVDIQSIEYAPAKSSPSLTSCWKNGSKLWLSQIWVKKCVKLKMGKVWVNDWGGF